MPQKIFLLLVVTVLGSGCGTWRVFGSDPPPPPPPVSVNSHVRFRYMPDGVTEAVDVRGEVVLVGANALRLTVGPGPVRRLIEVDPALCIGCDPAVAGVAGVVDFPFRMIDQVEMRTSRGGAINAARGLLGGFAVGVFLHYTAERKETTRTFFDSPTIAIFSILGAAGGLVASVTTRDEWRAVSIPGSAVGPPSRGSSVR